MTDNDYYEIVRQKLTYGPYAADKHEKTYELLKIFWNEEDIEILTHFPNIGKTISIKKLIEKTGKSKSHIKKILKNAAEKKTITRVGNKYGFIPLFPGLLEVYVWARKDTKENLKNAAKIFRYMFTNPFAFQTKEVLEKRAEGYEDMNLTPILPYEAKDRLIEINESVNVQSRVLPYETLKNVIDKNDKFAVVTCPCRLVGELSGEPCSKATSEMGCFIIGIAAQLFVELGWGRPLNREEALEYLKKTEEAGLVHNLPSNSPEILGFCNCCSCHCGLLHPTKEFGIKNVNPSNFTPIHNQERCALCKNCIKICPMEAISQQNGKIIVNYDLCLGCGVCAINCPENAIKMQKVRNKPRSVKNVKEEEKIFDRLVGGLMS